MSNPAAVVVPSLTTPSVHGVPLFDKTVDRNKMDTVVKLLYIEEKKDIAKKTGNPYQMFVAQCQLVDEDGRVLVGELTLPRHMNPPPPLGDYHAVFKVSRSQDLKIGSFLVDLVPVASVAPVKSPVAAHKPTFPEVKPN